MAKTVKKAKRSPAQIANNFKKGNKRGPGRPKMPVELIMMKQLSKDGVKTLLNKFLDWPLSELQAYLKDNSNPVLEYYIAKLLYNGIVTGDVKALSFLFDRLIGKVVDKVEISKPKPTIIELIGGDKKIILGSEDSTDSVDKVTYDKQQVKEQENEGDS